MSKLFEALQRLERDSGKPLEGVTAEAKQILQKPVASPSQAVVAAELERSPAENLAIPEDAPAAAVDSAFALATVPEKLDQIPKDYVTIVPESRVVFHLDPDGPGADRFRLLRMRLRPAWESGRLRTILITSAQAKEGKSTMVLNLATALAENGGKRVLIVESDLHRPSICERLGLPAYAGFAECLSSGERPLKFIRQIDPLGWYLLPAGQAESNPTELLQSPRVAEVLNELTPLFDWVLIDTPPAMPMTDTLSLKRHADGVFIVVRADKTPKDAVEAAIDRVGSRNVIGIILNGCQDLDQVYSDYRKAYGYPNRPNKDR